MAEGIVRTTMSFSARRELLVKVAPRYREASRKQKTLILNEFVASTGYKRKYAIRLLSLPEVPATKMIKRPRLRYYGSAVQDALEVAWCATNCIASKRLAPFLKELVPVLEHHGYLDLNDEVRRQLLSISPATIDRILQLRRSQSGRGMTTTKRGTLLKHQIPVRTFADWEEKTPGFFEADLVGHHGWSVEGSFLHTLVLTDVATAWIECLPLLHRSQHAVIQALDYARPLMPFPILGIDTDNGTEFINAELIAYCKRERITFTRGRAYKKNDQCYVEQKNGTVVRQFVGYDRFEGIRAYKQLMELYRALRLYINYFQPSMKLREKHRVNSRTHRIHDQAQTPFQRLQASHVVSPEMLEKLNAIHQAIDPVRLLKQITALQDALWRHAVLPPPAQNADKAEVRFESIVKPLAETEQPSLTLDCVLKPETRNKRKYRRTQKSKTARWWRTRLNPFEHIWDDIRSWLEQNPERTAKSILRDLQELHPGHFKDGHLRTLQRRVQSWRAQAIITFNDDWIHEDRKTSEASTLRGETPDYAAEILSCSPKPGQDLKSEAMV